MAQLLTDQPESQQHSVDPELVPRCSLVATICIQTNVSIEEVLTWKASDI